jgi:hypothetical protein
MKHCWHCFIVFFLLLLGQDSGVRKVLRASVYLMVDLKTPKLMRKSSLSRFPPLFFVDNEHVQTGHSMHIP